MTKTTAKAKAAKTTKSKTEPAATRAVLVAMTASAEPPQPSNVVALGSPFLTERLAAEYLHLSLPTLARLRLAGIGPKYIKLGRTPAYRREALDSWAASREFGSTSEARAAGIR